MALTTCHVVLHAMHAAEADASWLTLLQKLEQSVSCHDGCQHLLQDAQQAKQVQDWQGRISSLSSFCRAVIACNTVYKHAK